MLIALFSFPDRFDPHRAVAKNVKVGVFAINVAAGATTNHVGELDSDVGCGLAGLDTLYEFRCFWRI
jgi:hypothetical protein